jgi:hypothetical protein
MIKIITNLFTANPQRFEGVWPIDVYVMRLFYALMFLFIGRASWLHILEHKGSWEPTNAIAWCCWAAYATLSFIGIFKPLRMLPIMLFMVFYKGLWLLVVAWPLWRANQLAGSAAEELTGIFIWIILPLIFIPWRYVGQRYLQFWKKNGL